MISPCGLAVAHDELAQVRRQGFEVVAGKAGGALGHSRGHAGGHCWGWLLYIRVLSLYAFTLLLQDIKKINKMKKNDNRIQLRVG